MFASVFLPLVPLLQLQANCKHVLAHSSYWIFFTASFKIVVVLHKHGSVQVKLFSYLLMNFFFFISVALDSIIHRERKYPLMHLHQGVVLCRWVDANRSNDQQKLSSYTPPFSVGKTRQLLSCINGTFTPHRPAA